MRIDAPIASPFMDPSQPALALAKFRDPDLTASGARRARVSFGGFKTLWFNTGTLCNLACANCYIESTPRNDALAYLSLGEVASYLDELEAIAPGPVEIGFTGGEPFLNRGLPAMAAEALERGHGVLVLTNAMRPMRLRETELRKLAARYGARLTLRISLDHYTRETHDAERGAGAFEAALDGLRWLAGAGVRVTIAGRHLLGEPEPQARAGYATLFEREGLDLGVTPADLVLFPEMDASADVAEITEACWDILGLHPASVMCAGSRMVVKRRGAERPSVLACTLIAYDPGFDLGPRLADALGPVSLNHPNCARFCVLGGASCSG